MPQRLAIITNSADVTRVHRNAITAFLEGKGWAVWHWFEDLWLIDNPGEAVALTDLRDQLAVASGDEKLSIFVLATEGNLNHAAMVPVNSIPWLKEHWRHPRPAQ
jgi:hypothetical protein